MLRPVRDFFQAPDVLQNPRMWALSRPGADSSRRSGRRGRQRERPGRPPRGAGAAAGGVAGGAGLGFHTRGRKTVGSLRVERPGITVGRAPAAPAGAGGGSGGFFRVLPCSFSRSESVYFSKPRMEARTTGFAEFPFPRAGLPALRARHYTLTKSNTDLFSFSKRACGIMAGFLSRGPEM